MRSPAPGSGASSSTPKRESNLPGRDRVRRGNGAVADLDPQIQDLVDDVLRNDAAGHAEAGRVVLERKDLLTGMELAALKPLDGERDHVVDALQRTGDHGRAEEGLVIV